MRSIENHTTTGLIRFTVPDPTITAESRAFFTQSPSTSTSLLPTHLHSVRTSSNLASGPAAAAAAAGLDTQGFAYIPHRFSISDQEIFQGRKAEDIYAKECVDLVLKATGATRGLVHNIDIRQKAGKDYRQGGEVEGKVEMKGGEWDKQVEKFPTDELFVGGREPDSGQEPSRMAHIDLTLDGFRETLRWARKDMREASRPIFEAEQKRKMGEQGIRVPRFAAFSVWRPLFTPVKRDPLAVLDARTLDTETDATKVYLRLPSQLSDTGDYILEQWRALPPKEAARQKWYWMPEQKPEEVLIIKFCDSKAEEDKNVAAGCVHISPILPGTEKEEVRRSIEARVYAFWD